MSALGDPIRRRMSGEDLLRTVINEILELKNTRIVGKMPPKTIFIYQQDTMYLSHSEPVITTTTLLATNYDATDALYETSVYA